MKLLKVLLYVLGCVILMSASYAFAEDTPKDKVNCYTTWDDSYLYLSFKVDCPDIQGKNSIPNSDVTGDDSVTVFIETDNKHSAKLTPNCFTMSISAGGGSQFKTGNDKGSLESTSVWSVKYGPGIQGTINNDNDIDMGYSIEMAIPWSILKCNAPKLGDMMSFNVIVRRHGGKPADFVSLSPKVKTEDDTVNPSNWVNMVFTSFSYGAATVSLEKIVCASYVMRPPLINGAISEKEWQKNTSFSMDLPAPAGFVYEAKFPTQQLIMTPYYYWYQGDTRKSVPSSLVVQQGPWFSYDRVQWHKEELSEMVTDGIDVVLPVYRGDKQSREGFAAKGLDCMVSAIQELQSEGKPHPYVGMYLDTSSFQAIYPNTQIDLKNEEVKRTLYGMIRSFFDRIPSEYRAVAQAGKPYAGQLGNIVALDTSKYFTDFDSTFIAYCNERFAKDFGNQLVWMSTQDYKAKVPGLDAYFALSTADSKYSDTGRVSIGCVTPGFDHVVNAENKTAVKPKLSAEAYTKIWEEIIKKKPYWIFCDYKVDTDDGTGLKSNVTKYLGNNEYNAQYIRYNVPKIISSKQFAQAELVVKNIGTSPWRTAEGYAIAYRWYKNGRYYGESKVRRPLEKDVLPGDTIAVNIGIATVNTQGAPLPEGNCELRFEIIRLSDNRWFSTLGDQALMVPLTIGQAPEWNATYLTSDIPAMIATNQSYHSTIRMRNDGTQTWPKGIVKLGSKLYKSSNYAFDGLQDLVEEIPINDVRALLLKDCKPGEIAEFVINLNLVKPDKKPLESWKQTDPFSYQLRFDIYNGQKWFSELGSPTMNRTIGIFDYDYGTRVVDSDISKQLTAGQTIEAKVVIRNNGKQIWDRKKTKVGYHWYNSDGTEVLWDGITTPIKSDVQPGWPLMAKASVKVPDNEGRYVIVWDVMIDGEWQSIKPISRGGDILPVSVEVTKSLPVIENK